MAQWQYGRCKLYEQQIMYEDLTLQNAWSQLRVQALIIHAFYQN